MKAPKAPVKSTVTGNAKDFDVQALDNLLDEISKNSEKSPTIELSPSIPSGKYETSIESSELQELNEATSQLEAILTTVGNGKEEEISNPENPRDEEPERPASISDGSQTQSLNRSESVAKNVGLNNTTMEEARPNYLYYLARAVTDFMGQESGELSFKVGFRTT